MLTPLLEETSLHHSFGKEIEQEWLDVEWNLSMSHRQIEYRMVPMLIERSDAWTQVHEESMMVKDVSLLLLLKMRNVSLVLDSPRINVLWHCSVSPLCFHCSSLLFDVKRDNVLESQQFLDEGDMHVKMMDVDDERIHRHWKGILLLLVSLLKVSSSYWISLFANHYSTKSM